MTFGERHYKATLSDDDVDLIRSAVEERRRLLDEAAKLSNKMLAIKFDVTESCIERIAYFQTRRRRVDE